MANDKAPRAIQRDIDRLQDIHRSRLADQVRATFVTVASVVALVTGGFLAMYPLLVGMIIAWQARTTPDNIAMGVGLGGLAAIGTLLFVTLCVVPAAYSWMKAHTNAVEVQEERRQLSARVNLWHATGGNDWIRAAMSLVHLLEEMGQGSVAQRAVEHLVALQRRTDLLDDAAGFDAEADEARLVIDDQAAEILDRLGNLALEAAKSDRLPLEELQVAESDAKNRSRALAEVSAAASLKREI